MQENPEMVQGRLCDPDHDGIPVTLLLLIFKLRGIVEWAASSSGLRKMPFNLLNVQLALARTASLEDL